MCSSSPPFVPERFGGSLEAASGDTHQPSAGSRVQRALKKALEVLLDRSTPCNGESEL